ncbi:MAG: ion transporter [Amphiplicatus sp.]|nr:ion transporter [Amphiplicatus sp.]
MKMREMILQRFGRNGRAFELFIQGVIIVSLAALCLQTVKGFPDWAYVALNLIDAAALFVFVIEYGLRAMLAERPTNYLFSFWGLIDFLAIVPAIAFSGSGSYVFRSFRLLRIIRILKLARYSKALQRLARAFSSIRDDLAVFCFLSLIILFVAASGIYYFENEAQPDKFSSIPASMWWAISTLTTVGYGDVYPVTAGGKLFTVFILMVGLGLVAVPVGLIASALTRDEEESD